MPNILGRSKIPIHEQIKSYIYGKIVSGEWAVDYQIPSERDLSKQFKVSRVTIRQSMINLANEGLLRRVQGQGTFVSIPKIEMLQGELISITTLMQKQGRTPETILTKFSKEPLDAEDAEKMGYSIGEEVYAIQRIRRADGINIVLENTKLPYKRMPDMDQYDLVNSSVFSLMADIYNFSELTVYQTIEAEIASEEVARLLAIDPESPVVCVHRALRDQNNEVVEYALDYYPANRIRFVFSGKINMKVSQQKFRGSTLPTIETQ